VSERYEIKPLEWRTEAGKATARTIFGKVFIVPGSRDRWWLFIEGEYVDWYDNEAAAKSAAESWHRERLLPALVRVEGK
jgi:hypothetical protein